MPLRQPGFRSGITVRVSANGKCEVLVPNHPRPIPVHPGNMIEFPFALYFERSENYATIGLND
jgi:hypothetical protein